MIETDTNRALSVGDMILNRFRPSVRGLFVAGSALFFFTPPVSADFRCESVVSYRVKLIPPPGPTPAQQSHAKGGEEPKPTAAPDETKRSGEDEIGFALVEAIGADEKSARTELVRTIGRTRAKAREACHKRFEDSAGCIASKHEANATTMRSLDFAARTALQKAIIDDCAHSRGICSEPAASDPACNEIVKAVAAETPAGEGKKEDKKGKKK